MQCKDFVSVLEQSGLSALPPGAQAHLADCDDCQNYFADLTSIVDCAHQLPAAVDPPQRIWVSLRAQLTSEGLIHEPAVLVPDAASNWLQSLRVWFSPRSLATAAVGITLAVAAFVQLHKHNAPVAQVAQVVQPRAQNPLQTKPQEPAAQVAQAPAQQHRSSQVQAQALTSVQQPRTQRLVAHPQPSSSAMAATPSDDLYSAMPAALSEAEISLQGDEVAGNPAVEAALRKNLRTVNEFIAECEKHLKKHPQDAMAREYLNSAYQQKAELISALLDSGRSEQ
jgi:hypothetical protein